MQYCWFWHDFFLFLFQKEWHYLFPLLLFWPLSILCLILTVSSSRCLSSILLPAINIYYPVCCQHFHLPGKTKSWHTGKTNASCHNPAFLHREGFGPRDARSTWRVPREATRDYRALDTRKKENSRPRGDGSLRPMAHMGKGDFVAYIIQVHCTALTDCLKRWEAIHLICYASQFSICKREIIHLSSKAFVFSA